jgi:heptaprenyl diphosphate synthase
MMILLSTLFKKTKLLSTIGLSLAGALANNFAQLFIARFILFGDNTRFIAPVLLITGLITGTILGFFADTFKSQSVWYQSLPSPEKITGEQSA